MRIKEYDQICMWKDLHILYTKGMNTVFDGCGEWDLEHPLYHCLDCAGYNEVCETYKSLDSINRRRD